MLAVVQKQKRQPREAFNSDDWEEIRFDIDEKVKPDIIWHNDRHE